MSSLQWGNPETHCTVTVWLTAKRRSWGETVKIQTELLTIIKSLKEKFEELNKDLESVKRRRSISGSEGKHGR